MSYQKEYKLLEDNGKGGTMHEVSLKKLKPLDIPPQKLDIPPPQKMRMSVKYDDDTGKCYYEEWDDNPELCYDCARLCK